MEKKIQDCATVGSPHSIRDKRRKEKRKGEHCIDQTTVSRMNDGILTAVKLRLHGIYHFNLNENLDW